MFLLTLAVQHSVSVQDNEMAGKNLNHHIILIH